MVYDLLLAGYICSRDVANSVAKASRSIWEYLLSVSVRVRLRRQCDYQQNSIAKS